MKMPKTILFISNMSGDPWGGSEELWTRTARLLAEQGVPVAASVHGWPQLHRQISELSQAGVDLRQRPVKSSLVGRARRYMSGKAKIAIDVERSFGQLSPGLVVISNAFGIPPIEIIETCITRNWPFTVVTHSGLPIWWPPDELAARIRKVLPLARRYFFVSEANRTLAEKQLGYAFDNAEIIRNPLTFEIDAPIPWPSDINGLELRMACVGRLSAEKGQDVLFEALASPRWMERHWYLTLYGNGPTRDLLERLVIRLNLQDRVSFAGHVAVEQIWRENHVLVMPSRYEGGPMTTIEAMFCGRPVVATNVGSNPEVIEEGLTGFLAPAAVVECLSSALERMWMKRDGLQEMGKLAEKRIRKFVPDNPVEIFAEKLKSLVPGLKGDLDLHGRPV
jgi:glycosyltransferase involved in cell wall biosynthesis